VAGRGRDQSVSQPANTIEKLNTHVCIPPPTCMLAGSLFIPPLISSVTCIPLLSCCSVLCYYALLVLCAMRAFFTVPTVPK
jgi:hypothetical protein